MRRAQVASLICFAALAILRGQPTGAQETDFKPVTDTVLKKPPPGDWLRWRRDHAATGYTPLDQIDKGNVHKLRLAWSWAMGPGIQEQEPIIYNGTMYLLHPNAVLQALDGKTGARKWEYRRELPKDAATGDTVRNLAIYQNNIYIGTQDGHLVAIDATTGRWCGTSRQNQSLDVDGWQLRPGAEDAVLDDGQLTAVSRNT